MTLQTSLRASTVASTGTMRDVLLALDRGAIGVALVVAEDNRLLGIFTDGDARRALLAGANLDSQLNAALQRSFYSVGPRTGRAEVLDLMQARRIDVVPIVDDGGRLVGCHQLHDVLGIRPRLNEAVIMAGGRGTRLGALTQHTPKPMIRVAGRPILERLVLHLVGHGIRRIHLSINYLGEVIEDHFGDGTRFGCQISYLREEQPLGTAGALACLPFTPSHPLLVLNGDLVTQADFGSMLDAHAETPDAAITLGVRQYVHTVPFGCVETRDGRVVDIEEKPALARLINAGIYVVSPSLLTRVPKNTEYTMPGLISDALRRGEHVLPFEVVEEWIDVGRREQLSEARGEP